SGAKSWSAMCATTARASTWRSPAICLRRSSGCIARANSPATEWAWRLQNASSSATMAVSGPRVRPIAVQRSFSVCSRHPPRDKKMTDTILLVEDNADDEKLTLRALQMNNTLNPVIIARDGAEALELLLGTEAQPFGLVLLDLRLPKVHGLTVLQRMRADPRTRLTPVVILTSSKEEADLVSGYAMGVNSYIRKPVDFHRFTEAVAKVG